MDTNSFRCLVLLTVVIIGCTPKPNDSAPPAETAPAEAAPAETAQPVVAEPEPSPTPEVSANPDLLRQCIFAFDDPSGEALFVCGERYQIMVLPVRSGVDPNSLFAQRVDEAQSIFTAVSKSNVEIVAVASLPTRDGETAASYRASLGGPSDAPAPMVMLHSETDGKPKFVFGIGSKTPTELSFEAELSACSSFVRAIHDADDPKSLVASEEEAASAP